MSIEAMKQALEALKYPLDTSHEGFDVDMAELLSHRAIESLRQAISEAEKQEPVAWHEPGAYGNVTTHKDWALANGWLPLYKEKL